MKSIFTKLCLSTALTLFLVISGSLPAQAEEFKKIVEHMYDVDKNATLMIDNKYGEINCQVWTEMKVSVKVEIIVDAHSKEKAQKVFDRIDVDIDGNRNKVTGVTHVGNMSFNNADFSINYYIMMPKSMNIDLDNKFGEIFVEEVDGEARINLQYGEMEVMALNGSYSDITIKFGEGSVDYLKNGKLILEYSEFDAEGANDLDILSRFSELDIKKAESILLDSQYDDIYMEKTGSVDVVSRFSEIGIEELNGDFILDLQYGAFEADYIYAGFSKGEIDAAFTEVSLTFDSRASFQVEAEMRFSTLHYPGKSSIQHREEGYVNNFYKGTIGSDKSPSARLVIDSKNGDVDINF